MIKQENQESQNIYHPNQFDHDVVNVREVAHEFLTNKLAAKLKTSGFKLPDWVNLVKTSKARELAPYDPDWMYHRAGAVLRKVNIFPEKGLRHWIKVFGTKMRMGAAPNRHSAASGRILRQIFKQLVDLKMLEFREEKQTLSGQGKSFALDACNEVKADAKTMKKKVVEEKKPAKAEKPKKEQKEGAEPKAEKKSQKKKKGEDD